MLAGKEQACQLIRKPEHRRSLSALKGPDHQLYHRENSAVNCACSECGEQNQVIQAFYCSPP